ncbi:MAG: 16S rRNA (cytosine(1402)-N(4))-methyltransferase, partial [Planctomycetes bacterium]|nr:16S rRNA (cytosine(1402)-N(4))-methyltransferase [Planctomycetota bacterium]
GARKRGASRRTDELADLVARAVPAAWRRQERIHPATRVFQALRIAVNDELGSLETFLDKVFGLMKPGGRVVIIAFHSGEDRIVKTRFRDAARAGLVALPVTKPIVPAPEEVQANPRSRSARMRVAERLVTAG